MYRIRNIIAYGEDKEKVYVRYPDDERYRDYHIYKECVHTAFFNDLEYGLEPKITNDEKSILITLAKYLELSDEEVRLIEASIVDFKKPEIDNLIKDLKDFGIILHTKKDYCN